MPDRSRASNTPDHPNSGDAAIQPETGMTARTKGLLKFLIATPIAVVVSIWVARRVAAGNHPGPAEIIGLGLPGAFAAAGLLEFTTGIPLSELSQRWNNLKGWQRGVIGSAVGFGLIFLISLVLAFVLG